MDEAGLIRFFVDLTGQSESSARCVVIYLDILERDYFNASHGMTTTGQTESSGELAGPALNNFYTTELVGA